MSFDPKRAKGVKFNIGDMVECKGAEGYTGVAYIAGLSDEGTVQTIQRADAGGGSRSDTHESYVHINGKKDNLFTMYGNNDDRMTLIKRGKGGKIKKERIKKVNFLLKYDLDTDPVEEFETLKEVKARIDHLVQNERRLKRESMVVYHVSKKCPVKVSTLIKGI